MLIKKTYADIYDALRLLGVDDPIELGIFTKMIKEDILKLDDLQLFAFYEKHSIKLIKTNEHLELVRI